MNNFEETLKSAKLFRQTILGGSSKSLEDLFDFQETTIFYIPKAMHSHRSYWVEENLVIFWKSSYDNVNVFEPIIDLSSTRSDQSVYLIEYQEIKNSLSSMLNKMLSEWSQVDYIPEECLPKIFEINVLDLKRCLNLQIFS